MERRSINVDLLEAELTAVKAQNMRLKAQHVALLEQLQQQSNDEHNNSVLNVEYKIKAFRMEDERDRLFEAYEKLKQKYNTLQDAYLGKLRRTKALEETFQRQKTLTGLVMKSTLAQKQTEQELLMVPQADTEVAELKLQLSKLQAALDESHDIIDEMDFELESMDVLELQNQKLREQIRTLKAQQLQATAAACNQEAAVGQDADECDCRYKNDDADAESLERAAMTHSLIETVDAESNCLRRELLRSRWQCTVNKKPKATSDTGE